MGYLLVALIILAPLSLGFILFLNTYMPDRKRSFTLVEWFDDEGDRHVDWQDIRKVEYVDIMEAAAVVEQQSTGRELWRKVQIKWPRRPLTWDEEANLDTIIKARNPNVKL